jgi:hypothetical protein
MTITAQSKAKLMQFQRGRAREVRAAREPVIKPTTERIAGYETHSAGKATQIVPPIDTMRKQGRLTGEEHAALSRYAELKAQSHRSPVMDSITRLGHISGNNGDGPSLRQLCAVDTVDYMERDLGSLRHIVNAIADESITLTEWLSRQGRTRIKCETKRGTKVCKVYADKRWLDTALMELKMGARRIMSY